MNTEVIHHIDIIINVSSPSLCLGPILPPHLLDVRHAAGQLAVVVVVQPSLDRGQVHRLRHNLKSVYIYIDAELKIWDEGSQCGLNKLSEENWINRPEWAEGCPCTLHIAL